MPTRVILVPIVLALLLACVATAGPNLTSTTTTTTTTTATFPTSTTTTTTTTLDEIQCLLRTGTCGPFANCQVLSPSECRAAGGINVGPGNCSAPPTAPPTTTPPSACCTRSSPGGPFDQCTVEGLCECSVLHGGVFLLGNVCTQNLCESLNPTTTTTAPPPTTSSTTTPTTTTTAPPTTTTTTTPRTGLIAVCHKGRSTRFVDASALRAHLAHGDDEGACPAP